MHRRIGWAFCWLIAIFGAFAASASASGVSISPDRECTIALVSGDPSGECSGELYAGQQDSPDQHYYRSLLQFDVAGSLPAGATVTSARLRLYKDANGAAELSAYQLLTAWDANVTWDSPDGSGSWDGGDFAATADDTVPVDDVGWYSWDVTGMVKVWASGSNHGVLIGDPQGSVSGSPPGFSGSGSGPTTAPVLEVEYFIPCPSDPFAAAQSSAASTVYAWNDVLLAAFRQGGPPTSLSRAAAMMNIGIYDALNSVFFAKLEDLSTGDPGASETCGWTPYQVLAETPANTNANLAAGIAARDILTALFPGYSAQIATAFTTTQRERRRIRRAAVALGEFVADEVLAARASDGSGSSMSYTPASIDARGVATVADQLDAGAVQRRRSRAGWGNVTPFTLTSGSQFRQSLPGGFTTYASLLASSFYTTQFNDVKSLGRATAFDAHDRSDRGGVVLGQRPRRHLQAAGAVAPAHRSSWRRRSRRRRPAAIRRSSSREWSQQGIRVARLFAEVSLAMADSAIAAWDQKYLTAIDLWRPIDAIRQADTDGNSNTTQDASLGAALARHQPSQQFSPCFPAWVSGHATFGGTWSRVMENEFRHVASSDPFPLTLTSEDPQAIGLSATSRQFDSFAEAAEENARSRIYLGVHYQTDAEDGLATGRAVADNVHATALRLEQTCEDWDCTEPITP